MRDRKVSIPKVNWSKKVFVLAVIAFWASMTNHCALERIPGLEFLACSPQSEATPHQPSDCGDENDVCATVESGLYSAPESQIAAGKAPVIAMAFALSLLSDLSSLESSESRMLPEPSPPELACAWQFSFRAALPVRAPSFAS